MTPAIAATPRRGRYQSTQIRSNHRLSGRVSSPSVTVVETSSDGGGSSILSTVSSTTPLAGDCLSARSVPTEPMLLCGSFWRHWRSFGPLAMPATCGRPHPFRLRTQSPNVVPALSFSGSCGRPRIRPQLEKTRKLLAILRGRFGVRFRARGVGLRSSRTHPRASAPEEGAMHGYLVDLARACEWGWHLALLDGKLAARATTLVAGGTHV